jgi:hypothetical protein
MKGLAGKKTRPVSLKTRLRLASAWKKIGSHAFRTGRQAAADRLLNGLAESKMPTAMAKTIASRIMRALFS